MLYFDPNEILQNLSYLILPPLRLDPSSPLVITLSLELCMMTDLFILFLFFGDRLIVYS